MGKIRTKKDIIRTVNVRGHEIPFYRVMVHGTLCEVPQYLYRVDNQSNNGWLFCLRRQGISRFQFFVPDKGRSVTHSLDLAVAKMKIVLGDIPHQKNIRYRTTDLKTGAARTGISGVNMVWQFRGNNGYQLLISASAGSTKENKPFVKYVGTEFTVTDEKLQKAFEECRSHRKLEMTRHIIRDNVRVPKKNIGNRKIGVTLVQARQLLIETKTRDIERLSAYVTDCIPDTMLTRPSLRKWRQMPLNWHRDQETGLYIPDFITKDKRNHEWVYRFRLPCGADYGGSVPWGRDIEGALKQAIWECFFDSLYSTYDFIPEERVHDEKIDYLKIVRAEQEPA